MKTYRIANQILNISEKENIAKMYLYLESGSSNNIDYWMDITYVNGYKFSYYLGNVREVAEKIYKRIIDDNFDVIDIAR